MLGMLLARALCLVGNEHLRDARGGTADPEK